MKHTLLTSLLIVMAFATSFGNPLAQTPQENFQAYLLEMVSKFGFTPVDASDKAVTFNNGKTSYSIEIGEESPTLVQLKRIYPMLSHYSRVQILNEINDANVLVKCAHAQLSDDGDVITLTVEVMMLDGNDFSAAFPVYLSSLDQMAKYLDQRLP